MKHGSITKNSVRRLALLGLVMLVGTAAAAGALMYRQSLSIYRDMAYSYVSLANKNIRGEYIEQMLARGIDFADEYDTIEQLVETEDWETLGEFFDADPELVDLYTYWINTEHFILTTGGANSAIRYYYVVVPTQEDLIYLWDSDQDDGSMAGPMVHAPYSEGERENLMSAFRGEWGSRLAIYHENGEILGTAMSPVYEDDGKIVAVAAVDLSLKGMRTAFVRLLVNLSVIITLIMLAAVAIYYVFVRRRLIRPILTLKNATGGLVENLKNGKDEPFRIDVHTGDEIEALAHSFEQMDRQLRTYIRENAKITAEKERIGTELSLATRIQEAMLPNIFPPFPDRHDFDIYASMRPAKEVGGDFYDFFLIDEDRLGLVIADVSGKGIPAALFMMMSKIVLQNYVCSGLSPRETLETVNEQICRRNPEQMFVTVWLGILDLKTGKLTAANAGHEYPILRRSGGRFELLKDRHGFVLGGMEGIRYKEYELQLEPGDTLFLYTDGLAEATGPDEKLFGTDRILETLNEAADASPRELLERMNDAANRFAGDVPQFDDLTMLCLTYNGLEA